MPPLIEDFVKSRLWVGEGGMRDPRLLARQAIDAMIAILGRSRRRPKSISQTRESVVAVLKDGASGATTGIRIVGIDGQELAADLADDGTASFVLRGLSRQGEYGVEQVCRILVRRLNLDGASWSDPRRPDGPEQGIDCASTDGAKRLLIQVTRADQEIWKELAEQGRAERNHVTMAQALSVLREAIKKKTNRIPAADRARMILALDACETGAYAFETFVDGFRCESGDWAQHLGYSGIWLVGPNPELTRQLDR